MRHTILVCLILGGLALAGPVMAEQIIHFSNGTSMPIRSHKIQGEMIHVDLGGDAFIAFPVSMIDVVVEAGKDVVINPSSAGPNKVMGRVETDPNGSFPVKGQRPASRQAKKAATAAAAAAEEQVFERDAMGLEVHRPYANSGHPAKARLTAVGNRASQQRRNGEVNRAGKSVVNPVGSPRGSRPQVVGMSIRPGGPLGNPAGNVPKPENSSGGNPQDSGSGD